MRWRRCGRERRHGVRIISPGIGRMLSRDQAAGLLDKIERGTKRS
jgi:hypothetical protein